MGDTEVVAAPSDTSRDEGETAWRLRHLKRSFLKDATSYVATTTPPDRNWFLTESFYYLGRAVESSARAARSLFTSLPLQGQVNLLTTSAFDSPFQLLQVDRTRSVAYFAVGAPVASHGNWTVKAALNQGDLSSWIVAGNYARQEPADHRYQFGMWYGVHRYEGGNLSAIAAVPDTSRNVGAVYVSDEWKVTDRITLGYGGNYAHYDYLGQPAYLSPRVSATFNAAATLRVRGVAARQVLAPGAENSSRRRTRKILPPQRTFAPLTRDGFIAEDLHHYEVVVEQVISGATLSVRAFQQRVDDQLVTVFGMRTPDAAASALGHYFLASGGNVAVRGWGLAITQDIAGVVRGTIDYSFGAADWSANGRAVDQRRLAARSSVGAARRPRECARPHLFDRSGPPSHRDARVFRRQDEQRVYPRRRERRSSRPRRPLRHAGHTGFAVLQSLQGRLGNAYWCPQSVPRDGDRKFDLRRAARRPPPEAPYRRPHCQVLRDSCWIGCPNSWIRAVCSATKIVRVPYNQSLTE